MNKKSEDTDQKEYERVTPFDHLPVDTLKAWLEELFTYKTIDPRTFQLNVKKDSYFLGKLKEHYGFRSYQTNSSHHNNLTFPILDFQNLPENKEIDLFTSEYSPARLIVKYR